jgi:hypothetical protein
MALITVMFAAVFIPIAASADDQDRVLYWNRVLLQAFRDTGGPPTVLTRGAAMMNAAIYDTVNSFTPIGHSYLGTYSALGQDVDANIDVAAITVLTAVFPKAVTEVDTAAAVLGNPVGVITATAGLQAATAILAARAADGSLEGLDPRSYVPAHPQPGQWRPTGSGAGASPNWGNVTPFVLTSGHQFRPQDPGGHSDYKSLLASPDYASQVNEVQSLGSAVSTTRTADQTQAAFFWANDADGTEKPPGQLLDFTRVVSEDRGLSREQNARLFALTSFALADGAIVAWDRKYLGHIIMWRPEDAIHHADQDNNSGTTADATWQPLSTDVYGRHFSPSFPSYTSGHSTLAGAWAAAMQGYFGTDQVTFTGGTDDSHARGVRRTFTAFSQMGTEDAFSRVWLGVHYPWDCLEGYNSGRQVGDWVTAHAL